MEGTLIDLNVTTLGTFDVGAIKEMIFNGNTTINATSGDNVNVKIIDVQTKQLICDRTVRF